MRQGQEKNMKYKKQKTEEEKKKREKRFKRGEWSYLLTDVTTSKIKHTLQNFVL